jgi:hypothetical protein
MTNNLIELTEEEKGKVYQTEELSLDMKDELRPIQHDILYYAVNGFIHNYIMTDAAKMDLDKLVAKYDLKEGWPFYMTETKFFIVGGFSARPAAINNDDGIFLPRRALETKMWLFSPDYGNVLHLPSKGFNGERYERALENQGNLFKRKDWKLENLKDPEFIERGMRFGADIWAARFMQLRERQKPGEIKDFGFKILNYYGQFMKII